MATKSAIAGVLSNSKSDQERIFAAEFPLISLEELTALMVLLVESFDDPAHAKAIGYVAKQMDAACDELRDALFFGREPMEGSLRTA